MNNEIKNNLAVSKFISKGEKKRENPDQSDK